MPNVSPEIAVHFEPPLAHWAEEGIDSLWSSAIGLVVQDAGFSSADISLAVVDDAAIRRLNRKYLQHDYATDVITFPLGRENGHLEGEIVLSGETAARQAESFQWELADELLLYVIHGTLHLVGYDDDSAEASAEMRAAERRYLEKLGRTLPISESVGRGCS